MFPLLEKLGDPVERKLKAALRFVSAVNQSRLKVVLDPVYEAAAGACLRGVSMPSGLAERSFEENAFFKYKELSTRLAYDIGTWDFGAARPDRLTARERGLIHSFACGETSGFAVGSSFLHSFRNDPELGSFFGIWFSEELNHYWGYHRYLEAMGEAWRHLEKESITAIEFRSYSDDAREVAAANMYQELVAYLVYSSYARQVRDPFLAKMIGMFAKDELRHYKFYQTVVLRETQRDPSFRKVALKHFFKATTPMNQVAGSPAKVASHLSEAAFYFRKREFDFLTKQNEDLFGAKFDRLFDFFFRRHIPLCDACGNEVFLCACEDYEPGAHAAFPPIAAPDRTRQPLGTGSSNMLPS